MYLDAKIFVVTKKGCEEVRRKKRGQVVIQRRNNQGGEFSMSGREYVKNAWPCLEVVRWNSLKCPVGYFHRAFLPKITTELKTLVSRIDLVSQLRSLATPITNSWTTEPLLKAVMPPEGSFGNQLLPAFQTVKPAMNVAEAMQSTYTVVPMPKVQPMEEKNFIMHLEVGLKISNKLQSVPEIFNEPVPPVTRPLAGLLWQRIAEAARIKEDQMSEAVRRRYAEFKAFLRELEVAFDKLLLPMPRPAVGAVRVRGAEPTRGRGGSRARVSAIVLNRAWEREQELSLPVVEGPTVRKGLLTLVLHVEETNLVGRPAVLALMVEGIEVALCSTVIKMPSEKEAAQAVFELDLTKAEIKVRDGMLPLHALQVIIEPESKDF